MTPAAIPFAAPLGWRVVTYARVGFLRCVCSSVYARTAKDQPQYLPLPALRGPDGDVITRWTPTWRERLRLVFGGSIWLTLLTFNQPLQPIRISAEPPRFITPNETVE